MKIASGYGVGNTPEEAVNDLIKQEEEPSGD